MSITTQQMSAVNDGSAFSTEDMNATSPKTEIAVASEKYIKNINKLINWCYSKGGW